VIVELKEVIHLGWGRDTKKREENKERRNQNLAVGPRSKASH